MHSDRYKYDFAQIELNWNREIHSSVINRAIKQENLKSQIFNSVRSNLILT
jgi:hypothetical protein